MTETQLTLALDAEVVEAATRAAEREGLTLSAWLNRLARQAAVTAEEEHARRTEEGLAALREYEAEYGAFTPEELAWADDVLDRLGVRRQSV